MPADKFYKTAKIFSALALLTVIFYLSGCQFNSIEAEDPPGTGLVKGLTRDKITLENISGVSITINDSLVQTDSNGIYIIANVEEGEQKVSALKSGYIPETTLVNVNKNDTSFSNFSLTPASRNYIVTGYVRNDKTGEFIYQAKIDADNKSYYTDVAGKYTISGIATGTYTIMASAEGFDTSSYAITIASDTTIANFWLNQTGGFGVINGYVQNANTLLPVEGAIVTINYETTRTNADGYYIISDIPEGNYYLIAEHNDFVKDSIVVVINENQSTFANVQLTSLITPDPDPVVWEYRNTGINHTFAIPLSSNPNIDGEPLLPGDFIGVFYDSSGVDACAGYVVWNGSGNQTIAAWGDDSITPEKDGFTSNEEIIWKFKRISDDSNFDAAATYSSGPSQYSTNSITLVESLYAK